MKLFYCFLVFVVILLINERIASSYDSMTDSISLRLKSLVGLLKILGSRRKSCSEILAQRYSNYDRLDSEEYIRRLECQIHQYKIQLSTCSHQLQQCDALSQEHIREKEVVLKATPIKILKKKYYFRNQTVSWQEAVDRCKEEYKQLGTVNSLEDQRELSQTLDSAEDFMPSGNSWLGGFYNSTTKGPFLWAGEPPSPFTFTSWNRTEPALKFRKVKVNCVWIDMWMSWRTGNCRAELPYVCESLG